MHNFGSAGLVTGYIKQLLADFNLPRARVYTEELAQYAEAHGVESPEVLATFASKEAMIPKSVGRVSANQIEGQYYFPYIKDGRFEVYLGGYYADEYQHIAGRWQTYPFDMSQPSGGPMNSYEYGRPFLNLTTNLKIRNNIYDAYTHEYLGNYLRFVRDYSGMNLMPLYNCFSNTLATNLSLSKNLGTSPGERLVIFDSSDPNYRIFKVPVKLFKQYTIAIDSEYPVEFFCGIYNYGLQHHQNNRLFDLTYTRQSQMQYSYPILFDSLSKIKPAILPSVPSTADIANHLMDTQFISDLAAHESELYLFIKLSKQVDSSIVVLEGNYLHWNDFAVANQSDNLIKSVKFNRSALDTHAIFADHDIKLITPLQLLKLNTGVQIPFADRLIEYLLGNCITGSDDEPRENILMAQTLAGLRYTGKCKVPDNSTARPTALKYDMLNGIWSEQLRRLFYNYVATTDSFGNIPDNLGYIDKDVEKLFTAGNKTMLTFNAWEDINE